VQPGYALALLLSLALLPVIIPVAVSVWRTPVFSPRYGIIATIGLCPLAAAGVAAFRLCALRAVLLVGIVALSAIAQPVEPFKAHWREAADYLAEHMRPGDLAAVHIKASVRQYDYYVRRLRPDVPRVSFDGSAIPVTLPLEPPGRHVWLVLYGRFVPPRDILARGHWRVVSHKFFWAQIYIWELVSAPPATQPATRSG
jgi:hypothetical protein